MMNGSSSELEAMKQEILKEMRKEIAKAKLEIIEGKNWNVLNKTQIVRVKLMNLESSNSSLIPQTIFQLFVRRCLGDKIYFRR